MSMIWKSAILLAHHENCILMDRFVMMGEELVLVMSLSPKVVLFLNSQTDWKRDVLIIKFNIKHFYLTWKFAIDGHETC